MNNVDALIQEWNNTLNTIADRNKAIKNLDYFIQLSKENLYIKSNNDKPKVVMIGYSFPEEIIRALDIDFCYVFGGSYASAKCGNNLPKDSDDTTLSMFGLINECISLKKEDVLLIPLINDDMKKMYLYFENKATVITYEVPSYKEDTLQQDRYVYEIKRITKILEKHFNKRLSNKALRKECELSRKATFAFNELEDLFKAKDVISNSAFLYIANSYHFAINKEEWLNKVNELSSEIKACDNVIKNDGNIMIFGSPIYPPEYKALFSLEDINLKTYTIIHPDISHIKYGKYYDLDSVSVDSLARKYLQLDISPVFINNSKTQDIVIKTIGKNVIKGAIALILRDQIEYDYQYRCIESKVTNHKIPINRIETVYGNEDVEHLNLRLDAFYEMIKKIG